MDSREAHLENAIDRDAVQRILDEVERKKTMAVRAKVRCNAKSANEVNFTTVYEPDGTKNDENARFTKATPWGDIRLGIDNQSALEQFEINKTYYVDFTLAPS